MQLVVNGSGGQVAAVTQLDRILNGLSCVLHLLTGSSEVYRWLDRG